MFFTFASTILCLCLCACTSELRIVAEEGVFTLDLPRPLATDEAIHARVTIGSLPRTARIVVHFGKGDIAGTIAPFGKRPDQKAGIYTVPIPREAIVNGKVALRLEVVQKGADPRAPAKAEVEDVKLELVPVTK